MSTRFAVPLVFLFSSCMQYAEWLSMFCLRRNEVLVIGKMKFFLKNTIRPHLPYLPNA